LPSNCAPCDNRFSLREQQAYRHTREHRLTLVAPTLSEFATTRSPERPRPYLYPARSLSRRTLLGRCRVLNTRRRLHPFLHRRGRVLYFFWTTPDGKRREESLRTDDPNIARARYQLRLAGNRGQAGAREHCEGNPGAGGTQVASAPLPARRPRHAARREFDRALARPRNLPGPAARGGGRCSANPPLPGRAPSCRNFAENRQQRNSGP